MDKHTREFYIEDGEKFTKNELKSRLKQIEVDYDPYNTKKSYYVELYNKAIKIKANQLMIEDRLIKDTALHNEIKNKRSRDSSNENEIEAAIPSKFPKLEKITENDKGEIQQAEKVTNEIRSLIKKDEAIDQGSMISSTSQPFSFADLVPKSEEMDKTRKVETPLLNKNQTDFKEDEKPVKAKKINFKIIRLGVSDKRNKFPDHPTEDNQKQTVTSDDEIKTIKPNIVEIKSIKTSTIPIHIHSKEPKESFPLKFPKEIKPIEDKPPSVRKTFDNIPMTSRSNVLFPTARHSEQTPKTANGQSGFIKRLSTNEFKMSQPKRNIEPRPEDLSINGGLPQGKLTYNREIPSPFKSNVNSNITITSNQSDKPRNPFWKTEEGEIKTIMKYLIVGTAASVIFLGIYKCISYSDHILPYFYNTEGSSIPIQQVIETNEGKVTDQQPSLIDNIKRPVKFVYDFVTRPGETLKGLIQNFFIYLVKDLVWNFIKGHIWHIGLGFIMKTILYFSYKMYKDKQNVNLIFTEIKDKLKCVYQGCNKSFNDGLTEEEIIFEFSRKYNYTEEYFRRNIMPKLRERRKRDATLKEFESFVNGRLRLAWQWTGY